MLSKKHIPIIIFMTLLFIFSCWLMLHTLTYDSDKSEIVVASRLWSDFGAHLLL